MSPEIARPHPRLVERFSNIEQQDAVNAETRQDVAKSFGLSALDTKASCLSAVRFFDLLSAHCTKASCLSPLPEWGEGSLWHVNKISFIHSENKGYYFNQN